MLIVLRRLGLCTILLTDVCNGRLFIALVQITLDLQMSTNLVEDIVQVDVQLSTSTLLFNLLLNLLLQLLYRAVFLRTILGLIQDYLSTLEQTNPRLAFQGRLAHGAARALRLPTGNVVMKTDGGVWQCSGTLGKDDCRHHHCEHTPAEHRPAMSCVRTSRNIDHSLYNRRNDHS